MRQNQRSRLFLVRLWTQRADQGQVEYRGKVQDVVNGEAYYFNDWPTLIELMLAMSSIAKDGREQAGIWERRNSGPEPGEWDSEGSRDPQEED